MDVFSVKPNKGFTLIELVVVVGIMALLSSVMLANFPRFNKEVAVGSETSKLSLSLRKAQSYAMAVREFNPTFTNDPYCTKVPNRFPPYGINLDMASPTQYLIFGDINCSNVYDSLTAYGDEAVELINMERGVHITKITVYDALNAATDLCPTCSLSILYIRPGPSTVIQSGFLPYDRAEIFIASPDEVTKKKVVVRTTGQVSVEFVN